MTAGANQPGGDLGTILRGYRHASKLTQQQLADLLGYDRTYISMIERGRRTVTDRGTLTHIARTLAIPPHVLGIVGQDDADFTAMLGFGASVIRLADVARHSGRAADAVSELWPLITRLEARLAAGYAELETMLLLTRARVSFGVALGHLLPEEQLATAARWTGRALRIAWHLGDDDHPARNGAGLVLLARAAADSGQADLFDTVTAQCVQALKAAPGQEVLFSTFTVREARLRGLLATGRTGQAIDLAGSFTSGDAPPTPQWRVIERITTAHVLTRAGDERTAADMLTAALGDARTLRLPHQVQRIIRLTGQPGILAGHPLREQARTVLSRLDRQLAQTQTASRSEGS